VEKIKKSFKTFIEDSKSEAKETKEMLKLIWNAKDKSLRPEERVKIKNQGLDLFKLTFLGVLFVIPGTGILIIFLIKFGKRFGVNFLPSSFDKKTNE
jgi:hypothetical protein